MFFFCCFFTKLFLASKNEAFHIIFYYFIKAEKSLTEGFIASKGNDKHEDADSLLHNTTSHTQCLYQISKS